MATSSNWKKLGDLAKKKFIEVPSSIGVYILRWAKDGKPIPICRLGGQDVNGILYIGSGNLKRRIKEIWRCANEKC